MTPEVAAAGQPCDRCGTFSPARKALGTRQLCAACVEHVVSNGRFWSSRYATVLGAVLNPTATAVLLALNWQRLGEPAKARGMWINTGVLLLCYLAIIFSNVELPTPVTLGAGIGVAVVMGRGFDATWATLEAAGAQKANRFLPVVFTLLAFVAVAVVMVLTTPDPLFEP